MRQPWQRQTSTPFKTHNFELPGGACIHHDPGVQYYDAVTHLLYQTAWAPLILCWFWTDISLHDLFSAACATCFKAAQFYLIFLEIAQPSVDKTQGKAGYENSPLFTANSDWQETPKALMFVSKWQWGILTGLCVKGQTMERLASYPERGHLVCLTDDSPTAQRAAWVRCSCKTQPRQHDWQKKCLKHRKKYVTLSSPGWICISSAFPTKKLLFWTFMHALPLWEITFSNRFCL